MLFIYIRHLATMTTLCASVMTGLHMADLASHGQVQNLRQQSHALDLQLLQPPHPGACARDCNQLAEEV